MPQPNPADSAARRPVGRIVFHPTDANTAWVAFGGYGDDHHDRDEVARAALAAVQEMVGDAIDPRRVWVIGDTPYDIRCARAIGARAVAVLTGWHTREELLACGPDVLLDDLSDPAVLLGS